MSEAMNDAELSLKVAQIMFPDCKWEEYGGAAHSFNSKDPFFNVFTDDALGKMCVWLAHARYNAGKSKSKSCADILMAAIMHSDNPHRAIAEAIVESMERE